MFTIFRYLFFSLSPLVVFTVIGNSMSPTLYEGQTVLVQKKWFFCTYNIDDIIVFKDPRNGRLLVKRIKKILYYPKKGKNLYKPNRIRHEKLYFLVGDNEKESTDSRYFGGIEIKDTIGKVISP